jgi:hypothetical protein
VIAVALSSRSVGFAVATAPMRLDAWSSWSVRHVQPNARRRFLESRVLRAVRKFDPATLLVTHGTRWRLNERARADCRAAAHELELEVAFVDLEQACLSFESKRDLRCVADRLMDSYPELERKLMPVLGESYDRCPLRERRPLLSALAIAHAASVERLVRFG